MLRSTAARLAPRNIAAAVTGSRPPAPTATDTPPPRRAIERHLDKFFDRNGDRKITLGETYVGLRDLGVGRAAASAVAMAINVGLGTTTGGGLVTIDLDNIHLGKHGGDSGVLDAQGNFVPEKFEAIFDTYAKTHGDALTPAEVSAFRRGNWSNDPNANPVDFVAGLGEFGLLMQLGPEYRDGQPVLTKDRLHEFYNGDLFDTIAKENCVCRDARAGTIIGSIQNAFNTWIF